MQGKLLVDLIRSSMTKEDADRVLAYWPVRLLACHPLKVLATLILAGVIIVFAPFVGWTFICLALLGSALLERDWKSSVGTILMWSLGLLVVLVLKAVSFLFPFIFVLGVPISCALYWKWVESNAIGPRKAPDKKSGVVYDTSDWDDD